MPKPIVEKKAKSKPSDLTFEEGKYLRRLVDQGIPVCVRLQNNEEVTGVVEFYDASFIRLTRQGVPNLFIYKHEIKYLYKLNH